MILDAFLQFCNTNFEILLFIFYLLTAGTLAMAVMAYIRVGGKKLFHENLRRVLLSVLIFGQTLMVGLLGVIIIINYQNKQPLDPTLPVWPHTRWVKEDLTIYFINGNNLVTIKANGSDRRVILTADAPLREYHFSPDGKWILAVSQKDLRLLSQKDGTSRVIDVFKEDLTAAGSGGVIGGVAWAPGNQRFCYRKVRWSKVSSHDDWYVYDLAKNQSAGIKIPARRVANFRWTEDGKNLIYSRFEARDTSEFGNPFMVSIYRAGLDDLTLQLVQSFFSKGKELSSQQLAELGIRIYHGADHLSFGRDLNQPVDWTAPDGSRIGIDPDDHLYFVRYRWWKKRLHRIPRIREELEKPKYNAATDRLVVDHMRWLPSSRYVILEHYYFGLLILDPARGWMGILDNQQGNTFGWY